MSITRKRIDVKITLAAGSFSDGQSNTVTLRDHHVVADIANAGGESMGALQMRVYGLTPAMMTQLTTIGPINSTIRAQNKIELSAGDSERGMKVVYSGVIDQAWMDFHGAPDVFFNLVAFAGLDAAVKPIAANTYKGQGDVATIMAGLAATMGVSFENNGVSSQLSNPYFSGAALTQVKECARAADIHYTIDRGVLAIWPQGGSRKGSATVISSENGMVGYPSFTSNGLTLITVFNPDIKLGGQVQVKSSLTVAVGIWTIYAVNHSLETERAGGSWFTQIQCVPNAQ